MVSVPEKDRILVVDDEPYITDLLSTGLEFEGFAVEVATTGIEAMQKVRATRPDLVLLDVMLPDAEGIDICRRWREEGEPVPVLFLTARDATEDKLVGLAVGDDYVTKPFSLSEVVARIRAVLRRTRDELDEDRPLRFSDLVMDVESREVWRQGVPIELTATEFNLLHYLLENARRVVSKFEILDQVWGYGFGGDPNIVETYISYLRKKVDEFDPPLIHTVRGVGYSLRLPH
ncbi:MAG TPA: response regulator transcription factor [Acidimicrobiales bacterium]|nr:response regulator transcription factor [Acidimicrobiales bacterium]